MSRIRTFVKDDIPQVAEVHRAVMETGPVMTSALRDEYERWLSATYLDCPMFVRGLESLVCEDEKGEVVGFFGVVARQVLLGGQTYRASVGSNFCLRPAQRGALGLRVAREYLSQPADLVFIDRLTDRTRQLWDHLGWIAMPQSVRWTLPLRPVQHALSVIGRHVPARWAANLIAAPLDVFARRMPRSPFSHQDPGLNEEPLTGPTLARLLGEFGTPQHLRPLTTDGSTAWLVDRARAMKLHGDLQMVALRDDNGTLAGWYLYYARRDAPADVLQLVATPVAAGRVLAHLARHALSRGVLSLTGTLDPVFLSPLSAHWAVLTPSPIPTRWMMVHSTRREILEAFWQNRILLSQLDGEWCHQFR